MSANGTQPIRTLATLLAELVTNRPISETTSILMEAASKGDAQLGSAAREVLPLIVVALMGMESQLKRARPPRRRGRPNKSKEGSVDGWRAYQTWCLVKNLGHEDISNRGAIALVRQVDEILGFPKWERTFPVSDQAAEQSLSRGKAALGFTGNWECSYCEKIRALD